ncbi:MAG: PASTA domain-containing protein [Dehalococcoidia bacterium]|nr:MAG: PASTA domain-containing protein [Dehalococcoidia bacterium]
MNELGKVLSEARVQRGLTLEDCERDTRISKRYLDALEREDWKIFPAPVYSRAFLRTYAQYLGLNPAELMRAFQAQAEEPPPFQPLPQVLAPSPTGSMSWLLAGGVLLFLLIAGIFLYMSSGGTSGKTKTPSVTAPTVAAEASGGGPAPAVGKAPGEVKKGVVPDLKDLRLDDALAQLDSAGLSFVVVETDQAQGQAGIVLSQDPEPGTKGNSSTSVTLVVPRG